MKYQTTLIGTMNFLNYLKRKIGNGCQARIENLTDDLIIVAVLWSSPEVVTAYSRIYSSTMLQNYLAWEEEVDNFIESARRQHEKAVESSA